MEGAVPSEATPAIQIDQTTANNVPSATTITESATYIAAASESPEKRSEEQASPVANGQESTTTEAQQPTVVQPEVQVAAQADKSAPAPTNTHTAKKMRASTPEPAPKIFYKAAEEDGKVQFIVVTNDNTDRSLIWLVNLKEIFAKQLPKMPREYIVRLLFDRYHQSLICLEGDQVVGGISFKPYEEQRFGEIAFCAVSATHQVKGYGTRLMNHLKEYVKTIPLTHFLTYADNFAIGYFKKQGFSANVSMPKERWKGYIKDYDGGTLMECVVHPQIDYFRIPELVARQNRFLLDKIAETQKQETVYPGLSLSKIDDPYNQIPGLREAGWSKPVLVASAISSSTSQAMVPVASLARALVSGVLAGPELQKALCGVLDQVCNHKDAWPFREPVPASVVDYLQIIKEPMDLSLIRRRLESEVYSSAAALRRDLQLMLDNCRTYNRPDTSFYKAAVGLQRLVNDIFGELPPASS